MSFNHNADLTGEIEFMSQPTARPTAAATNARRTLANAIRALAMDAVQSANSGHPGAPMGMADIAEVLWNDYLKHNPQNPEWCDRDRFILSNGHGSMLLYSLLHLTGYPLGLDELKKFRQLGSKTAGHPEREPDVGIETTTGPLGQGLANGVGLALAEKVLAAQFNRPGHDVVDHGTWVFLGDGCLMEGISHEACSLAGTMKLGKLTCIYDDNNISIDGEVGAWFTDDTPARFASYGWHVVPDVDGHDSEAVAAAIDAALAETERPTLICCKTVIGFGAPNKQGTAATHGAPLGEDEIAAAREALDWPWGPFEVPQEIRDGWDARERGRQTEAEWQDRFEAYREAHPELAAEFSRRQQAALPEGWAGHAEAAIAKIAADGADMATRKASLLALNAFAPALPELIGGSADLTGSNNTLHATSRPITADDAAGNYIYFGVREFAMTAICNGLALHGGLLPYSGTFLTFSDYARNAVRLASLMRLRNVFVYTHDSIGLGEDGPTHQPVEHVGSLRLMPNLNVWRPCDTVETAVAWRSAIEQSASPAALVLTRQGLPHQERSDAQVADIARGGYVLSDSDGDPELIIIATGSEVALAQSAAASLRNDGHGVRVVSMPCVEIFDAQPEDYRRDVLPPSVTARLALEAGATDTWWRFVGTDGAVIGLDEFGLSAPAGELFEHFGFTADRVAAKAKALLGR